VIVFPRIIIRTLRGKFAMSKSSKPQLLAALLFTLVFDVPVGSQTSQPIDTSLARQYFQEAKSASEADKRRLWNVALYGPMLFVEPDSRFVVANQADRNGLLHQEADVYVGKLPDEVGVANTATKWAGVTWTMVVWPLPADRRERVRLMTHELFHRIQDSIGLPASNPTNRHLDSQDGRTWLRMEWRALEHALYQQGVARRQAIADAIYFRRYRQSLFPQALADENALETNEGLAEYTGIRLSSRSEAECFARAGYALNNAGSRQTFTRSFAYASGPAYGLLLDAARVNWRRGLKAGSDLGAILQKAMSIKLSALSATEAVSRSGRYDGDEVIAAEGVRERRRREALAKYRSRLIEGPVLVLPIGEGFSYTFNPNNVISFEEIGLIYPTARVTDDWGILEVSDGVLMFRDANQIKKLHVAAPTDAQSRPLQGPGWKLTLGEGWLLEPGVRKGDFVVRRKM
jgi:hypothetical protein